ncbi:LysR family transcriptional regulator [Virgibacillus phasianinus]|uniref:LysR family transcriptional regulator n=1 Tax=Virgibacillus phasianinus TaxID=2017483 RepID=A0A220U6M7_9BACI|nr:LysR family transcriptional regulator [Virgibacillus phasianinus]ASK63556.1 LysR family transcriptional regulator [Virgibacillus phasianinus]
MKIDDYLLLIKLNDIGTIRGTAKAFLISQPAVTQRLRYIEDYFGQTIFIRTSKKLLLTPVGEMIIKHANSVLEREKALKSSLLESSKTVQGTLSIACSSLISQRYLPAMLGEYTSEYPNVEIDLVTGISEDIKRDHKNYHVCIIRGEKLKESTCSCIFEDPLYIFDTETFPKNKLKERPLIAFKSDDSMHELVDNWLYHHQHHIKPLKTIRVDQIETCKQFMKQGLGMAVLPKSVSDTMMDEYPHVALTLDNHSVTRSTWVCYQEEVRKLPQVEKFLQTILNRTYI